MAFDREHTYYHAHIGFNYRMPDSQAKLALESLRNVDKELARRRAVEKDFNKLSKMPKRDVVWVLDTIHDIDFKGDTRPFFRPLSSMPMWGGKCTSPKAEYYSKIGKYYKL